MLTQPNLLIKILVVDDERPIRRFLNASLGNRYSILEAENGNDARAAKDATKTIPLVGTSMGDPVANGLIESLARPGGNLTGVTSITDELAGKRLELLKEIVPNLSVVALLWNTKYPDSARALYQAPAREMNLQI